MTTAYSRRFALAAILLAGTALTAPAFAQEEKRIGLEDQTAIAVTIYNENLALVRDSRRIALTAGRNKLAFVDVSSRMRSETALLSGNGGPSFRLLEQNLEFDLLTPAKLLEKSVGQTVRIVRLHPQTGEEIIVSAKVLSTAQGVVLQIGDRIETGIPGRIIFDRVPPNLRARPTLTIDLDASAAGTLPAELTYLTGGLSWRADYVANLSDKEDRLELNGWVTLVNQSGTSYPNAKLQLVAGDVNIVRDRMDEARARPSAPPRAAEADGVRRQAVGDYHLYEVARPVSIQENQQKQIALMKAEGVAVAKEYRFEGQGQWYRSRYATPVKLKAAVFLNISNDKSAALGIPLPRGVIRVYKKDASGKAVFLGEDGIDHTAEGEKIRLRLGNAFDVSGERVQTEYRREGLRDNVFESAYKIVLNNAKDEPVTVTIAEAIPADWTILAESHRHRKISSNYVEWSVPVPAKGKAEFTYKIRVTY